MLILIEKWKLIDGVNNWWWQLVVLILIEEEKTIITGVLKTGRWGSTPASLVQLQPSVEVCLFVCLFCFYFLFVLFCFHFLFLVLFFLVSFFSKYWCRSGVSLETTYQLNALVTGALSLRPVLHFYSNYHLCCNQKFCSNFSYIIHHFGQGSERGGRCLQEIVRGGKVIDFNNGQTRQVSILTISKIENIQQKWRREISHFQSFWKNYIKYTFFWQRK